MLVKYQVHEWMGHRELNKNFQAPKIVTKFVSKCGNKQYKKYKQGWVSKRKTLTDTTLPHNLLDSYCTQNDLVKWYGKSSKKY